MRIATLVAGIMGANCYILSAFDGEAAIIDPGGDGPEICRFIDDNRLRISAIINTHGHVDHIGANGFVQDRTGAPIMIHASDAKMLLSPELNLSAFTGEECVSPPAERLLKDGDVIPVGKENLLVAHTPGHTRGGISIIAGNWIISGDTLFFGSIGRTDFPGGSHKEIINSIRTKLFTYPDDYIVYPGHGEPTTIGEEKPNLEYFASMGND